MRHQIFNHQRKVWNVISGLTFASFQKSYTPRSSGDKKSSNMTDSNANLKWLSEECPEFTIPSKSIQILKEPSEFFEKLKEYSTNAKKRITLASLYIGTGVLEKELVSCIQNCLDVSKGNVKVHILVDYTRGSRGKENTRTLFLPLLKLYHPQMKVSLYHTPKLRGFIKWLLPERWNETIGLSHLKVYLFDDTLLLSGANLSDQYFTNRQDRYIVFHNCKELCNYFDQLVSTISSFSFNLNPDNTVDLQDGWNIHPIKGNFKEFIEKAQSKLEEFMLSSKKAQLSNSMKNMTDIHSDTFVYPLLQLHTFGIQQDEKVTEKFLCSAEDSSCIKLASGYFNLTNHYMNIILKSTKALFDLLVASPKVNGFYGASGVSGAIPMAYTHIAKTFFKEVIKHKQENRIKLHEYERSGWTFHVKGLWYYKPNAKLPSVTFIGSPNFGYRSVYKDLEAQVVIVTENKDLQRHLHEEQQTFYDRTNIVNEKLFDRPDRKVSLWVKLVTFFIRDFF